MGFSYEISAVFQPLPIEQCEEEVHGNAPHDDVEAVDIGVAFQKQEHAGCADEASAYRGDECVVISSDIVR